MFCNQEAPLGSGVQNVDGNLVAQALWMETSATWAMAVSRAINLLGPQPSSYRVLSLASSH